MTEEVNSSDEYDIKAITITEILRQFNYNQIDILKIDIEGAEKELFSENYKDWLGKVDVLIIELHDRMKKGCSDSFYSAVKQYDFNKTEKGENIILTKKKCSHLDLFDFL